MWDPMITTCEPLRSVSRWRAEEEKRNVRLSGNKNRRSVGGGQRAARRRKEESRLLFCTNWSSGELIPSSPPLLVLRLELVALFGNQRLKFSLPVSVWI